MCSVVERVYAFFCMHMRVFPGVSVFVCLCFLCVFVHLSGRVCAFCSLGMFVLNCMRVFVFHCVRVFVFYCMNVFVFS